MPNYKQCRLCSEKYVPVGDERICPKCEADIIRAVSMPTGSPVVAEEKKPEPPKVVEKKPAPTPEPKPAPVPEAPPKPEPVVVEAAAPSKQDEKEVKPPEE